MRRFFGSLALCVLLFGGCGDDTGNDNNNHNVESDGGGPACGNGAVEGSEACDDGAGNSDTTPDACRTDCTLARCGDGVADSDEECDEGAANSDTESDACRTSCLDPYCGDGVIDLSVGEVCDDGNAASGDGCSPGCWTEVCGDGVVDPAVGEVCDDGNTASGDGCSTDCASDETCGNFYVDSAVGEACDDGNTTSGDGCSADCMSAEVCGNAYLDTAAGEQCDDGNNEQWDGCNSCSIVEFAVHTTVFGGQYEPAISAAGDGRFVVTWRCSGHLDGDGYGVFAQRHDANATRNGPEFQVNTHYVGDQQHADVAMADDGSFVVVWETYYVCTLGCLVGQRYDATGAPIGAEFVVSDDTENAWQSAVAAASDGRFVVAWLSGLNYAVRARMFDASGSPLGASFKVNASAPSGNHIYFPDVSMADDGRFVVVWEESFYDGSFDGIGARRYDASAGPLGSEFTVNTWTTGDQQAPAVDMAGDGRFVVVWQSDGQDGDGWGIYGQRYDAQGGLEGGEFLVPTVVAGNQMKPAVTMVDDGRFVVAWQSDNVDGDLAATVLQRFSALGAPLGAPIQAHDYYQSDQMIPAIASADDGGFVVTWVSTMQDGSSHGVYAQRFDAAGTPLGVGP